MLPISISEFKLKPEESLCRKWAQLEAMVGTDKRIALVAEDLVKHWEARYAAMEGKVMILCHGFVRCRG